MSKLRSIWNYINDIFSAIHERREKKASERNFRRRELDWARQCRHWYDATRIVH